LFSPFGSCPSGIPPFGSRRSSGSERQVPFGIKGKILRILKKQNRGFLLTQNPWYVYIVECRTGDLYVGITKDVNERVAKHNKGTACRYTKYRRPVKLIYIEQHTTRSEATQREIVVKKYSHRKKLELTKKR